MYLRPVSPFLSGGMGIPGRRDYPGDLGRADSMTLLLPLLAALAIVAPPPTDTVFILGTVERDLTGDGRAEVLRLVAAGKTMDSLDVTFSIMSDRAILYTDRMVPLTRRWGYDAGRRMSLVSEHRARVNSFADWFFGDGKFMSPDGFVAKLRDGAGRHIPLIPHVINADRAEGTPSDMARAASTWEEIQRSAVTIFTYSPGGDSVRAIAWSKRDQRFYQLWECC